MKENNLVFSFTDYDIIDEQGISKGHIKCPKFLTYNKLLKNNYIGCLTVIYDTKTLGKLLMPKIRKRQDWVLWLSIMARQCSYKYHGYHSFIGMNMIVFIG